MAWVPLESNPEVLNKYLINAGMKGNWELVDVLGLDPELLAMVPKPVVALLLLFPITEKYDEYSKEEEIRVREEGQKISESVFFLKQTIRNACGAVALIHSVANNLDKIELEDGHLKAFLDEAKPLDPDARGELMNKPHGISTVHEELAQEGQSEAPDASANVNYHFVTFVHSAGGLYELDGRKAFPVRHGDTTTESLIEDAAKVCQEYMKRDPDNLNFSIMALAAKN